MQACFNNLSPRLYLRQKLFLMKACRRKWTLCQRRKNISAGPSQPPTLMLIEGSASDQDKMDKYRDIILPMMKERGAYYICFQIGGDVEVLNGEWSEAIFAISRWPTLHQCRDFWLSTQYQKDAIPLRLDIGSFQVVTLEGERDDI